jgi:hypothetical protein
MTELQRLVLERIQNGEATARLRFALDLALEAHYASTKSETIPAVVDQLETALLNHRYIWRIRCARIEEVRAAYAVLADFGRREDAIQLCKSYAASFSISSEGIMAQNLIELQQKHDLTRHTLESHQKKLALVDQQAADEIRNAERATARMQQLKVASLELFQLERFNLTHLLTIVGHLPHHQIYLEGFRDEVRVTREDFTETDEEFERRRDLAHEAELSKIEKRRLERIRTYELQIADLNRGLNRGLAANEARQEQERRRQDALSHAQAVLTRQQLEDLGLLV